MYSEQKLPITKVSPKIQKLLDSGELSIEDLKEFTVDNILSTTEVSKILGVSRQRLSVLISQKRLKSISKPGYNIFLASDIENYILTKLEKTEEDKK